MRGRRVAGLAVLAVVLVGAMVLSLAVGTESIPVGSVVDALLRPDGSAHHELVRGYRVPRTLLGLAAGVALGLAGTLMQALTRNPLADPGILGINAGAAAAVAAAISFFGLSGFGSYVWFAFAGAALTSVPVYALGGANPVRLALAGATLAFGLTALTQAIMTLDPRAFNELRFWVVGSLAGRRMDMLVQLLPFLALGMAAALFMCRALNALALGAWRPSGRRRNFGVGAGQAAGVGLGEVGRSVGEPGWEMIAMVLGLIPYRCG